MLKVTQMNIIGFVSSISKYGRYMILLILLLNFCSVAFAQEICCAMQEMCRQAQTFLVFAAMMLIILAGAVYAIGQVMGAETRARASVWATSMLVGALIGLVIYLVVPAIIRQLLPTEIDVEIAAEDPCNFGCEGCEELGP
jgi:hypothetical protein